MLRESIIFLSESSTARAFSMRAPGARTMARRFVAGETLDDGLAAARELVAKGFTVSLDYLGESVSSRAEARAAADVYVRMLQRIGADAALRERVNVSLKLTQMGQDIARTDAGVATPGTPAAPGPATSALPPSNAAAGSSWPLPPPEYATPANGVDRDDAILRDNVTRILAAAREHGSFVRFDMEGTPHTQRTLDFFRSLWDDGYTNVGIVLQSYLRRTEHDVREANLLGCRVRLCKGAYQEPEQYAFQDKAEVDSKYIGLLKLLLSEGNYPGLATHDEAMIAAARDYTRTRGLPASGFEFQMLYGIRRDLQHQLLSEGYNLRIYVPFGEAWYPYLMRRMAERPANLIFIVTAVLRESPLRFLYRKKK
ncbi:MAG TPA: proline dehydrogenase family protein [Longimicrobiales bacterium]|nr:proline dehydrogenase family protein [Longimicrobiales bacterium]